jgi:hypothetical protein
VKADPATEITMIDVLDRFCSAFTRRDPRAVMALCGADVDLVVVTSESPILRGPAELRYFLDRYAAEPTTYSWRWDHHDVSQAGDAAWLLASGRETAVTGEQRTEHPYRMTMVAQRRLGAWLLLQVHGSSPHE